VCVIEIERDMFTSLWWTDEVGKESSRALILFSRPWITRRCDWNRKCDSQMATANAQSM